jgi:protein-disulfide isomerase
MRSVLLAVGVVAVLGLGVFAFASRPAAEITPVAATVAGAASESAVSDVVQNPFPEAMTERSLGSPDAPVVIDEYFALTCPHCAKFHKEILPQLKAEYIDTGKVRLVFHDFVFNEIGLKAAMVARCVKPDAYYELTKTLFEMQDAWGNPSGGETVLKQVAGFAGLAPAQYDGCVSYQDLSNWILNVRVEAVNNFNINSTPTFLFRGGLERVVGAQTYADFKAAIDRQLAKAAAAQAPAPQNEQ